MRLLSILGSFILLVFTAWRPPASEQVFAGLQPQLSTDTHGNIRLVFGRADSIFCATSNDGGNQFSKPIFVGAIPGMHLGNTRGPQLASSAHYSVITAIAKDGTIHFFRLNHASNTWQYGGVVNDKKASAPEGLMSIAADAQDRFYAVWLDVRYKQTNNIYFSTLDGQGKKWAKNRLLYVSPDGHVCECCKPSIAVSGNNVAIQYRNWYQGSRDLYLLTSNNSGGTFGIAQKLGVGTWKLKGCPMDGGGVVVDGAGNIQTVWQREGIVYYCKPGTPEQELASGRSCSIALNRNAKKEVVLLQQGNSVKLVDINSKNESDVGTGGFAKGIVLPDGKVLCAWEADKTIHIKQL